MLYNLQGIFIYLDVVKIIETKRKMKDFGVVMCISYCKIFFPTFSLMNCFLTNYFNSKN